MVDTTTICIFCPTGKTFTFREAILETDNEHTLIIVYTAMSDTLKKRAVIQKTNIVGWAFTLK